MRTTAALAIAGTLMIATAGHAADFARAPTSYAPSYSWFGPYVGANFGYQSGSTANSGADPSGVLGGLQAGINWQSGQFVYGLETDVQWSDSNGVFAGYQFSNPWFGTTRVRGGYALNNLLFFATLGFAYGETDIKFPLTTESHSHLGWVIGGGLEYGLTQNWTAKAEYLYIDLSNERYALTGFNHDLTSSVFRVGVNYKF